MKVLTDIEMKSLLGTESSDDDDDLLDNYLAERKSRRQAKLVKRAIQLLAMVTVVINVWSVLLYGTIVQIVACLVACYVSITVLTQEAFEMNGPYSKYTMQCDAMQCNN